MGEAGFPRRVLAGEPAGEAVARLLEYYGIRRVLVVTDRGVASTSAFREILEGLKRSSFEVAVHDGVPPEPPVEAARAVAEAARSHEAEAVVAVGGGSVIDAAKAGVLLAVEPEADPVGAVPFQPLGVERRAPLLVAVPSTAGTGSEASYAVVLTVEEGGVRRKAPAANYELLPYAVVLDPGLPSGAPARVAVGAAADALSHALESLVAVQATALSRALAEQAARMIFRSAPAALGRGDRGAWEELQAAAFLAGAAFSSSGLGLAHAIAHPLGAALGTHHGSTVGVVVAHVVALYYERVPAAKKAFEALRRTVEADGRPPRPTLLHHILDLYNEIGQPAGLEGLGVDRGRLRDIAGSVAEEALHDPDIAFSPYIPGEDELRRFIEGLAEPPKPPGGQG